MYRLSLSTPSRKPSTPGRHLGRWQRSPRMGKKPAQPSTYPGLDSKVSAIGMSAEPIMSVGDSLESTSVCDSLESTSAADARAQITPSIDFDRMRGSSRSSEINKEGTSDSVRTTAMSWLEREECHAELTRVSEAQSEQTASRRSSWVGQRFSCQDLGRQLSDNLNSSDVSVAEPVVMVSESELEDSEPPDLSGPMRV